MPTPNSRSSPLFVAPGAPLLRPSAFTPAFPKCPHRAKPAPRARPPSRAVMQLGAPSTQIGRPKTSIKKDVGRVTAQPSEPQADAERGSAKARPRRKTQADEVPMYKVILLGDEEYVEAHVVTQLQKTVQLEKKDATRIFWEAQGSGSSIICVVCEEHAEFYAQQLKRQEIFVVIEKDE